MRQRREDIRNIALIVGSGCLGALAVGIGLTAATSVDVHRNEVHYRELLVPADRGHRTVSISVSRAAKPSEELEEAAQKAVQTALDDLEKQLDETVTELEAAKHRVEVGGHSYSFVSLGGVRIRGAAGTDPVVYVDGVRLDGGLEALNPEDIDAIEVLKGSKATEQYGEEGKNGVVIVITKAGKKRKGGGPPP